ncbi:hypothetical protein X801_08236, partial [Opisthorchis viverrini]
RRDPSKRQIKPVATTAPLELFDDLDDDSDSEFVCEDQEDEDTEQEDSDSADSSSSDESDSSSSNEDVVQANMMESTVVSEKPSDQGENEATISDKELDQSRNLPEDDQSTLAPESEDAKVTTNVCLQPAVGNVAVLQEKKPTNFLNTADPFFAHCRQHTDKVVARQRRRNYLAAMSRWRWKRNQISEAAASMSPGLLNSPDLRHSLTSTNETMAQLEPRVQRKLDQFRSLYEELLKVRDKPYVPTTKTPLLLEHSPLAMRLFVLKAKRLQLPLELTGQSAINDSSKAPPSGYPIFSPDFISYFFEREKRIAEVMKRISALQDTQRELQISDASASHSYN